MRLVSSCLILLTLAACKKNNDQQHNRSFYMAVTPWPADFTQSSLDSAYRFINDNCDMVSHHFDEGIPYEEGYNNLNWPQHLQNEIATRKTKVASGKKFFLSVAPLNLTRKQKADYYRESSSIPQTIKDHWASLAINDNKVVTAYVNYISYLIDQLKPQFVNYGVESNEIGWNTSSFQLYKDFIAKVYAQLKVKYSSIPLFISFMVYEHPLATSMATQLIPYTDYLTLSAYPYIVALSTGDGNTDPSRFASDLFTRFISLAPQKPFGFAETGFIAEDLVVPSLSLRKRGTEEWQKDYLNLVCQLTNDKKGKFVIWFCNQDYDAGNNRLKALGMYTDVFALWEDTGMIDEKGKARPAMQVWKEWLNKPVN